MRIFVIGNQDAVLGLALAGVDGRIVTTAQQVAEALDASLAIAPSGCCSSPPTQPPSPGSAWMPSR